MITKKECPNLYMGKEKTFCRTSTTLTEPNQLEQRTMCKTNEYDFCPIFLSQDLQDGNKKGTFKHGALRVAFGIDRYIY